jgi:hypothetical protein
MARMIMACRIVMTSVGRQNLHTLRAVETRTAARGDHAQQVVPGQQRDEIPRTPVPGEIDVEVPEESQDVDSPTSPASAPLRTSQTGSD